MEMSWYDWVNCTGAIFRIYRASGKGAVRSGDLVGIYYTRTSWLSCVGRNTDCGKSKCPGSPTSQDGFENRDKWYECPGNVFRIYAKGKESNVTIVGVGPIPFITSLKTVSVANL